MRHTIWAVGDRVFHWSGGGKPCLGAEFCCEVGPDAMEFLHEARASGDPKRIALASDVLALSETLQRKAD